MYTSKIHNKVFVKACYCDLTIICVNTKNRIWKLSKSQLHSNCWTIPFSGPRAIQQSIFNNYLCAQGDKYRFSKRFMIHCIYSARINDAYSARPRTLHATLTEVHHGHGWTLPDFNLVEFKFESDEFGQHRRESRQNDDLSYVVKERVGSQTRDLER